MITLQQAKALKRGDILHEVTITSTGKPIRWRVIGKVQTWKRNPNRVRVPLKHGFYTYYQLTEGELQFVSLP